MPEQLQVLANLSESAHARQWMHRPQQGQVINETVIGETVTASFPGLRLSQMFVSEANPGWVSRSGESVDAPDCFSDCLVQRLPTRYQLVDPGIRLNGPTAMSSGPTR